MFVVGANLKNKQDFRKISYLFGNVQPLKGTEKNPQPIITDFLMQITEGRKTERLWTDRQGG